jgi:hypothetical protein
LLQGHTHNSHDEWRSDHQVSVLWLNDEGSGQELAICDVDGIVGVEVLVEERPELA